MKRSLSFRSLAATAASSLLVFGPGLSGYEAAAQTFQAPVVNTGFSLPGAGMDAAEQQTGMDLAIPEPSLSSMGLSSGLESASLSEGLRATELAETAAPLSTRLDHGATTRISDRALATRALKSGFAPALKSSSRMGSMSSGDVHGLGASLERTMTRSAASNRSGDVTVELEAGMGELSGRMAPAASRGLNAAPEKFSTGRATPLAQDEVHSFVRRVYDWMAIGLGTTAFFAYAVGSNAAMTRALFSSPVLVIGLVVAELALVIGLGALLPKLSFQAAAGGFLTYAALNGVLFSSLLQVYAASSIVAAFGVTAGMFAGVAAFGHVTKKNLDGVGAYAGMALWGLILATVANLFLHSTGLSAVLNYAGVLVFVALTAFDAQKIRKIAESGVGSDRAGKNLAIWGALTLYLDFINLFLYVLKIMGKAKEKK